MSRRRRIAGTAAVATLAALSLAGCGFITTVSTHGVGTCNDTDFALQTSQDAAGENLHVSYTGPADVALMFTNGFYSDSGLGDYPAPFNFAIGNDSSGTNTVRAIRLNPDNPGWSTSGSGDSTVFTFDGSVQTLLNGATTGIDQINDGVSTEANSIFPVVIGVSCDSEQLTDNYAAPDSNGPATGLTYAAAQPLFPNNMQINPFEIVSSTPITDGVSLVLRYSADTLAAFGSFTPELPATLSLVADNPDVANTSLENMWLQALNQGGLASLSTSPPIDNGDGTLSVDVTGSGGPISGDYLLLTVLTNSDQSAYKIVFSTLSFGSDNSVVIDDPFNPTASPTPTESAAPAALASTGVDGMPAVLAIAGGLLLTGLVAAVGRRRSRA